MNNVNGLQKAVCPACGNPLFRTKKMTFHFGQGILFALIAGALLVFLFQAGKALLIGSHGKGAAQLMFYIWWGLSALLGWILNKLVKREWFFVDSCTRCTFKVTERI